MFKFVTLTLVVLLTALNTFAIGGDYKGNPGYVMYCSLKKNKYEMTDLYEIRAVQGYTLKFADGLEYSEILENMFKRIERLNPTRANLYRSYLKTFSKEASMVGNSVLKVLAINEDWGAVEKGCELKQAVVQFKSPNLAGYRYFVDSDIWNKLSERNKAALALHEFIYREGLLPENSFQTSSGVRYLNGVYHSELFETLSLEKYLDTLNLVGFQMADANGYPILLHTGANNYVPRNLPYEFYDENHLYKASMPSQIALPFQKTITETVNCLLKIGEEENNKITFYKDGKLKSVEFHCAKPPQIQLYSNSPGVGGDMPFTWATYAEDGYIDSAGIEYLNQDIPDAMSYEGPAFKFVRDISAKTGGVSVAFNADGEVSMLCMAHDYNNYALSWITLNGKRVTLLDLPQRGGTVKFDSNRNPTFSNDVCTE
jgi:hypothetical protein